MPRPVLVAAAWLGGLALVVWLDPPWIVPAGVAALATLIWVILAQRPSKASEHRLPLAFACALALTAALAALRLIIADWRPAAEPWQALVGHEVALRGVVDDAPDEQGIWTVFPLAVESATLDDAPIIDTGLWQRDLPGSLASTLCRVTPARVCAGRVWVRVPGAPHVSYGERVALTGKIGEVRDSERFSYREFLARRGVLASIDTSHVSIIPGVGGVWARRMALTVQQRVETAIDGILPPPESDLLAGVLLGLSRKLPDDVMEALRRSSLSHIVVISGYNITILVGFISALFLFGQRAASRVADDDSVWSQRMERGLRAVIAPRVVMWTTLLLLVVYTLLVGASPSAVRAALMGAFVVWAAAEGRPSSVLIALALSALFITLISPWAVVDVGFQLSFAGALGMIVLATPLDRGLIHLTRLDGRRGRGARLARGVVAIVAATMAATILTAPLIALYFSQVSLVGLLANALVLPAQPALMLLGGIATGAGLVWLPLGRALAVLAWLPLEWTLRIPQWLAAQPWAAVDDISLFVPQVAIFYVIVAAWVAWLSLPDPTPRLLAFALPHQAKDASAAETTTFQPIVTKPIRRLGPRPDDPASDPTRQRLGRRVLAGAAVAVIAAAVGVWWLGPGQIDGHLRVTVLPTGNAVVVRTPSGERLVVGGGSDAAELQAAVGQAGAPWSREVAVVAASRADAASLKPLVALLRRYDVAQTIAPPLPRSSMGAEWDAAIEAGGSPTLAARLGTRIRLPDGVTLEVVGGDDSEGEVAYRLTYGGVGFLLAGGLRHPTSLSPDVVAVLLVSGHADDTLAADLQRAAQPALSIIHGDGGIGPRLSGQVMRLGEGQRAVTLTTDGENLWVDPLP